jgi:hypothetical protein
MSKYEVAQNPNDKLWYVIGYTGRSKSGKAQYMPVSCGMKTKLEALKRIDRQHMADAAAVRELAAL